LKIGRCLALGRRSLVWKNSYIATLVERHTRYVMLAKVANKDTRTVVSARIKQAKKLPSELYRSLTWDRARNLPIIDDLRRRPTSTFTSAIRKARDSAGRTRTPMVS
jgi:IS30 family transposase